MYRISVQSNATVVGADSVASRPFHISRGLRPLLYAVDSITLPNCVIKQHNNEHNNLT